MAAEEVRLAVLTDPGAHALDSVLAAIGTFWALRTPVSLATGNSRMYAIEGSVYLYVDSSFRRTLTMMIRPPTSSIS